VQFAQQTVIHNVNWLAPFTMCFRKMTEASAQRFAVFLPFFYAGCPVRLHDAPWFCRVDKGQQKW
jgi:hypothetical protein